MLAVLPRPMMIIQVKCDGSPHRSPIVWALAKSCESRFLWDGKDRRLGRNGKAKCWMYRKSEAVSRWRVQAGGKRVNLMFRTNLSELRGSCNLVHKLCRAKPVEKAHIFSRLLQKLDRRGNQLNGSAHGVLTRSEEQFFHNTCS